MAKQMRFAVMARMLVTAAIFAACGGKAAPNDGTGGGGASGGVTIGCPATKPWTRTEANGPKNPCSKEGQVCEYGTDFDPRCDDVLRCDDGEWAHPLFGGGGDTTPKVCGSPSPPLPTNGASCPASAEGTPSGASCSASGTTCGYDGVVCTCGVFCRSYPVGQRDCDRDAGITENCCDRSQPSTWHCFEGAAFCASPRPRVGDPCAKEGDACGLAEPGECGQAQLQCAQGHWKLYEPMCPISTARAKEDITYLTPEEQARVRDELLRIRLARYRYKAGDASPHLGFILEDMPDGSPAVLASRDRVDLYGFVSMAVATMQEQQKQIDRLEKEVRELRRQRH